MMLMKCPKCKSNLRKAEVEIEGAIQRRLVTSVKNVTLLNLNLNIQERY